MATLGMQCVVAILTIVFGVAALRTAGEMRSAPEHHRGGWILTGIVFTILGCNTAVQNLVAAPWAFFAGEGSPAFELYIRFSPMGNHSRGFLVVAYAMMMVGFVGIWRVARSHFRVFVVLASFLAMAVGVLFGLWEGPLVHVTHWTATAISDSAELIFLLGALFVGLIWNTTDRLLWLAIVIFAVHELLDVTWISALAWADSPGAWIPFPIYIHLYASIAYVGMTACALRRGRLARSGVKVPGVIELPTLPAGSMLG